MMVEAVSGQEVVEQRANLIRELTRLCKVVIRSGEDLVYTGNTEGFAPDIRDAPGDVRRRVGLEGRDRHAPAQARELGPTTARRRCRSAAWWPSRSATRWRRPTRTPAPRSSRGTPRRRSGTPRSTTRSSCCRCSRRWARPGGSSAAGRWPRSSACWRRSSSLILVLTFVPWKLTIEGRGSLLPEKRRNTYAPVAGIVVEVPVEHGQLVKKGDLLLRAREQGAREGAEAARRREAGGRDAAGATSTRQVNKANNSGNDDERNQLQGQLARGQDQGQERRRSRSRSSTSSSSR